MPLQETVYPLSAVSTPPSVKYSSFNSSISNPRGTHSKACCLSFSGHQDRSLRKRSVTCDDCNSPFNTSFKRARIKSSNNTQSITDIQNDTPYYYYNTTAFPSPSPTPISQHPHYHQEQQQSALSVHHQQNTNDQPLLNALWNMPITIDTFDTLPAHMKTYMLFQLLKRSTTSSLKFVNSLIMPVIKRDVLSCLPHELALQVIRQLDVRSLCRAATVSKTWRQIVDHDQTTWKRLLCKDGFMENDDNEEDNGSFVAPGTTMTSSPSVRERLNGNDNIKMEDTKNSEDDDGDPMDIDDDGSARGSFTYNKDQPLLRIDNPYKQHYRERHTLRENWRHGTFERTCFRGHNMTTQSVVTCLQFDDDKIISGVDDRVINIYDTRTGRPISTLRGHEGGVWTLQYIGNTLVSGSTDRSIRVWDIERGVCTHVFKGHMSTVRCLQIVMPTMIDGQLKPAHPLIISGSRDSTIRVWRLPDPRTDPPFDDDNRVNPWHLHTLTGHSLSVRAITAHGNTLVSGSYDTTVSIFDLETGRLVHRLEGHAQKVYTVVIDPQRNRCMSGSMDGSVRIWDLTSGQCLQILDGHAVLVGLLGLSKNHIVSGSADGTLRIWSSDTGICQHVLSGHRAAITCFQHDDQKVISGSEGGLKMWDIKTGKHTNDLITDVDGIWRVAFDKRRCVAAVYKNGVTSFEVLDFGVHGLEASGGQLEQL
ncbi:unnamed protein product [Absidia cylindrospora]